MPFSVGAFFVLLFDGGPGDFVRGGLVRFLAPAFAGLVVLFVGVIVGFGVDMLRVFWELFL